MDTLILCVGGIGDQILGLQCALTARDLYPNIDFEVVSISRDEVFKPLHYLFSDRILITQHEGKEKWGEHHWILNNQDALRQYPHPNKYYVVPDLLHRNPLAFDFARFRLHPQIVREQRVLLNARRPTEKIIYTALNTSTSDYIFPKTAQLVNAIARACPDYKVYFNDLTQWAGMEINNETDTTVWESNVIYGKNVSFLTNLEILKRSSYCICLDNGISHIAYQLGIPRTLISRRTNLDGLMWQARWYPQLSDCIGYDNRPGEIAYLIKTNLEIPQTTLIPRQVVLDHLHVYWPEVLGFKH